MHYIEKGRKREMTQSQSADDIISGKSCEFLPRLICNIFSAETLVVTGMMKFICTCKQLSILTK